MEVFLKKEDYYTLLKKAVLDNDVQTVKTIFSTCGVQPRHPTDEARIAPSSHFVAISPIEIEPTLIYKASIKGYDEIVQLLCLNQYCGADDTVPSYSTPLYVACQEGHLRTAKILVQYGADIEFRFRDDFTPLYVACQRGNMAIVEFLIGIGANPNVRCNLGSSPLYIASQEGKTEIVDFLLNHGANHALAFRRGFTPLYVACRNGHADIARKLIMRGADIEAGCSEGSTPLYVSCQNGFVSIVKLLLDMGANPNAEFLGGYTSLYVACQNGYRQVVEELIATQKCQVDKIMPNESTALYISCQNGHTSIVALLINAGANANQTVRSFSPLHISICKGYNDITKILLDKADIEISSNDLYLAYERGNLEIAKLLVSKGANISEIENEIQYFPK